MQATTSSGVARRNWLRWAATTCGLTAALACATDDTLGSGGTARRLRVSGSGVLETTVNGDRFLQRYDVSAYHDGGRADGILTTRLSNFDRTGTAAFDVSSRIDCLLVEGNTAWIGATVIASGSGDVHAGDRYLLLVRDTGDDADDLLGAALASELGDVRCTDKPAAVAGAVIVLGDFAVGASVVARPLGTLRVGVTTMGQLLDPDGYTVRIGAFTHPIGNGGLLVLADLLPRGPHSVGLEDVAPNCHTLGLNPSGAAVSPGDIATVWFTVRCEAPPGTLRVTTRTTGVDKPGGFTLEVRYGYYDYYPVITGIGANATVDVGGRQPGTHSVTITAVPPNCRVQGNQWRDVLVEGDGATINVAFDITCVPAPFGRVTGAVSQAGPPPADLARARGPRS